MTQEIYTILNTYNNYKKIISKHLYICCVDIVEEYLNGFVHLGKLKTQEFEMRTFNEVGYTSFQIKYIHNLYFFDFWRVESYDWGGDFYTKIWKICHYSYVYKNGILLHDCIKFIIDSYPGCIEIFGPSYPIYNIKILKKEHFVEFKCSSNWINSLNNITMTDLNNCENLEILFQLFYKLTECKPQIFYENNKPFNLK